MKRRTFIKGLLAVLAVPFGACFDKAVTGGRSDLLIHKGNFMGPSEVTIGHFTPEALSGDFDPLYDHYVEAAARQLAFQIDKDIMQDLAGIS